MTVAYPDYALPLPREAFQVREENTTIRTKMASGRARQRQRFDSSLKFFQLSWSFNDHQFLVWRMFHREALNFGANYFTMQMRIEDVLDTKTIRIVEGSYQSSYTNGRYIVSAVVECEDMELPLYGLYSIIEALQPDDDYEGFIDITEQFHDMVHTNLPESNTPFP